MYQTYVNKPVIIGVDISRFKNTDRGTRWNHYIPLLTLLKQWGIKSQNSELGRQSKANK